MFKNTYYTKPIEEGLTEVYVKTIKDNQIKDILFRLDKEQLKVALFMLDTLGFEKLDKKSDEITSEYFAIRGLEFNPPTFEEFSSCCNYYSFYSGTMCYCSIYRKGNTLYLADNDCMDVLFYGDFNKENYEKVCKMAHDRFLYEYSVEEENTNE